MSDTPATKVTKAANRLVTLAGDLCQDGQDDLAGAVLEAADSLREAADIAFREERAAHSV